MIKRKLKGVTEKWSFGLFKRAQVSLCPFGTDQSIMGRAFEQHFLLKNPKILFENASDTE